jgi:phage-related protein
VLQANAIQFAIGKATEAIGFLNSKFEEAKSLQLANVTAATTFSSLTGQSYEDAAKFIDNMNARLAKSAAALPGATQDYKNLAIAIQDNVLEAFKDPAGKLNQKGFEDSLSSIAESYGALSAASGVAVGNTTLGLSKMLAGSSTAELRQIQFFEQNAVILNEVDKRLKGMNKSALKDLDIKERVKLIQEVGQKFITEDFKKQAGATADALLQSFQSTMFDPTTGVFGIMRDLDLNTSGVQSAFTSMNEILNQLIGPAGAFTLVGEVLQAAGINLPDPMLALKNSLDFVLGGIKRVNQSLAGLRDAFNGPGIDFTWISYIIANRIAKLGDGLASAFDTLSARAAPLFNQGVAIISERLKDPEQFYVLGRALGYVVGRAVGSAAIFLAQIDTGAVLVAIGRAALGINAAIVGAIEGAVLGVIPGLVSIFKIRVNEMAETYYYLFESFAAPAREAVQAGIGRFVSLAGGITAKIQEIAGSIGSVLNDIGSVIGRGAAFLVAGIGQGIAQYLNFLSSTIPVRIASGTLAVAGTLVSTTFRVVSVLAGHINAAITGAVVGAALAIQGAFSALATIVGGAINSTIAQATNLAVSAFVPLVNTINGTLNTATATATATAGGINSALNSGMAALQAGFDIVSTAVSDAGNRAISLIKPPIDLVASFLGQVANTISSLVNGVIAIVNKATSVVNSVNSAINSFNPVPAIQSGIQGAGQSAINSINSLFGGARYSGHIGNAAGGFLGKLLGAAKQETANMPAGAQLLIANSSETILPSGGLGGLVRGIGSMLTPTAVAPSIGSPIKGGNTINLTLTINAPSGDAGAIASATIDAIQRLFEAELGAQLGS